MHSRLMSHILKTYLNIILPSMTWFSKKSPSFRFPHQSSTRIAVFSHACQIPVRLGLFELIIIISDTTRRTRIIKLFIKLISSPPCYFIHLNITHLPQYPLLDCHQFVLPFLSYCLESIPNH